MDFKFIKNISKDQAKDATRLALQSSLAAAVCYYLMVLLNMPERFVGILSAVLVIEPSIGNTFQQAKGRMLSTVVGALIGIVFVVLIPWQLGVILSLLFSMFIINGIASFKPEWRYGVVAAAALALSSEADKFDLVVERLLSIGFGVLVGIVITFIVWPDKAENRTLRYVRKALKNTLDRFKIEFENTRESKNKTTSKINDNFSTNINQAKKTSNSITFQDSGKIKQLIKSTEKLFNSITIIQRVAEKSDNNISNGEAGIEQNSEKVIEKACEIIEKLANKKQVEENEMSNFSDLIDTTKSNINLKTEDKQTNMLRSTFMFGLTEVKDSLQSINKNLKEL
ncbi:FUSC family protein [uncultured Polaribacter sp.]|uniref:FUSC family protein n=1 Tax=uncultured Polaribacter sp. TaxID=174711 RepID=UPI0026373903|nr:FUSC family protein [uncultured Polaribacter sp.]